VVYYRKWGYMVTTSIFHQRFVIIDMATGSIKFSTKSEKIAKEVFEAWREKGKYQLVQM
jgi:hypothetical protein